MASFLCHDFAVTKRFRLERIVRWPARRAAGTRPTQHVRITVQQERLRLLAPELAAQTVVPAGKPATRRYKRTEATQ